MQGPLLPGTCVALCMSRTTEADLGNVQPCVSDVNVGMDEIIGDTYLCEEKSVFLNPSWTPAIHIHCLSIQGASCMVQIDAASTLSIATFAGRHEY